MSSRSRNPVFIFVPGAWHSPARCFVRTCLELEVAGYRSRLVFLPSLNADPPLEDMEPDVEAIRREIESVVLDDEDEAVVVMHSSGGVAGCEACRGLTRKDLAVGGVVRLVFCTAFMVQEGTSLMDMLGGQPLPWFDISDDGMIVTPKTPVETFYHDIADEQVVADELRGLGTHSYRAYFSPLTYPAWKDVPSTYLLCERDKAIPPDAQRRMVKAAVAEGAEVDTISLDSGHSPMFSRPELLIGALKKIGNLT